MALPSSPTGLPRRLVHLALFCSLCPPSGRPLSPLFPCSRLFRRVGGCLLVALPSLRARVSVRTLVLRTVRVSRAACVPCAGARVARVASAAPLLLLSPLPFSSGLAPVCRRVVLHPGGALPFRSPSLLAALRALSPAAVACPLLTSRCRRCVASPTSCRCCRATSSGRS